MPLNRFTNRPHQFEPGDRVFLRPIAAPGDWAMEVIEQLLHRGWPHYRLRDPIGGEWMVSQLELSSKPFVASGRLSR